LEFGISNLGFVSLKVYNVLGNEVASLVNENKPAGSYEVVFNGEDLSSGIYYYTLSVDGNLIDSKRMVLLK
jgi:CRISPR/Cas system-associated protein Cas7 (RAMP superfamily)